MRKLIALIVLLAVVFLVWNRRRVYVRDPLGSVMRNGVEEKGAQVYINFANDVLLQNYHAPMYVELVQQSGRIGTPAELHCVAYIACLLDTETPTLLQGTAGGNVISMNSNEATFHDASGQQVHVRLR